MGRSALIESQVAKAFKLAGDLAKPVLFTNNEVTEYNFTSKEATVSSSAPVTVLCIVSRTKRPPGSQEASSRLVKLLSFQAKDLKTPSVYDTVVLEGDTWTISSPFDTNGFITTVEVSR